MQQHAATFIAETEVATGADLPQFVKDEFDAFLECGILAHGFLRLRCGDCGHDNRVITRFLLKQAGVMADEADSGAVTLIERFGSAANLNIHLHCLVLVVIPSNGATQTRTDGKLVLVMWSRKAST